MQTVRRQTLRWVVRGVGIVLIVAGVVTVAQFVRQLQEQRSVAADQTQAWRQLVDAAAGPPQATPAGATPGPTPLAGGAYLKLTVPKLSKEMVAIDSDWTGLRRAPMVHYHGSPAPGEKGNMLVAFHREFEWPDINKVGAGDQLLVETTDRRTFVYQVDFVRIVRPSDVSLLSPTDGSDLTLITCDPWLRDYNRMLFRAHLVGPSPAPTAGA
jgi:sortase A